jgi:thiol-disulfide isomerase/thioredoxin
MNDYLKSLENKINVIIMIGASWCSPCNQMTPNFNSISNMKKFNSIKFIKLDLDEDSEICDELKIEKLPTLIYYKNMTEEFREINIKTIIDLNKFVNKCI